MELFDDNEISEFYLKIGQNVKRIRKEKGLSQLELANTIGHSSVALVSKAEIGTNNKHFNLEHLYKIAKVLEVDLCTLVNVT